LVASDYLNDRELTLKRWAEKLCIAEVKNEDGALYQHAIDDLLTDMNGEWKDSDDAETFYGLVNWREDMPVTYEEDPEPEDVEQAMVLSVFCGAGRSLKLCIRKSSSVANHVYINTPIKVYQPKGERAEIREIEVL